MNQHYFDIQDIIKKLLLQQHLLQYQTLHLLQAEIHFLCREATKVFLQQPIFLELETPLNICGNTPSQGDIHGQFKDLLNIFNKCGHPPKANYIFLGDYVDRGKNSLQTICLLLAYKIKYPQNFFLLRGNHECCSVNKHYGFYDQCKRRFNVRLWKTFFNVFNSMPVAAQISAKILCMHGGLSPNLKSLDQLFSIQRPTQVPDEGLLCDLLWADPNPDIKGWVQNESRGVSYEFGNDIIQQFLQKQQLEVICRAHQVVEEGYEFLANKSLVTIFSAPNYCGQYQNRGAVMIVNQNLNCSFIIIK